MALRIFKYEVKHEIKQTIMIPYPADIVSCAAQNDSIVLYAQVDDESKHLIPVEVCIIPTGLSIDQLGLDLSKRFILDTVFFHGGMLVFHVFVDRMPAFR